MTSLACLWGQTFEGITGTVRPKPDEQKSKAPGASKDSCEIAGSNEATFLENKGEERLECPICFEAFNSFRNTPHVLWCGHTLCKCCVLRLQRAILKLQKLCPIVLPLFVSCPWCSFLSLRFSFKGNLKFPTKNYFVLWMVDKSETALTKHHQHKTVSSTASNSQIPVSYTRSRSCPAFNHHEEQPALNQEERIPSAALLSSLCKSLFRFSPPARHVLFCLALLLIFVALHAAHVNNFLLAVYAFLAFFAESAFILLPKLCLPDIDLVG